MDTEALMNAWSICVAEGKDKPTGLVTPPTATGYDEYKEIERQIAATCSLPIVIESVVRIENVEVFQSHEVLRKSFMLKFGVDDPNMLRLFHGTKHHNVDQISANGFQKNCEMGTFGTAVYAAVKFQTAIQYTDPDPAGRRCMFICRAVAGRPAVASAKVSLNAPPYLDTEQMIRFTCVKDARFNPEVYAFFEEKLVYPEYVVYFFC